MSFFLLHLWIKYGVRLKPMWAIMLQPSIDWTSVYNLDLLTSKFISIYIFLSVHYLCMKYLVCKLRVGSLMSHWTIFQLCLWRPFKGPTLSPSFPRIRYINLTHDKLSILINWLELSLVSEAWNAHTMRWLQENGSRGPKTDKCGEKRKNLIFCWCD